MPFICLFVSETNLKMDYTSKRIFSRQPTYGVFMVITRVIGGFGNQLFQFAVGYALARERNTILYLDISSFRRYLTWPYQLSLISLDSVKSLDREFLTPLHQQLRIYLAPMSIFKVKMAKEPSLEFHPWVAALKGNIYLEGYWQSEEYFKNYHRELADRIIRPETISLENQKKIKGLAEGPSCAVHIRRGDYIGNSLHEVCTKEYYLRSMDYIAGRVPSVRFLIFTDDYSWACKNFGEMPNTLVNRPSPNSYEDFLLMNACQNSIISNSTFSWWATWLRVREGIVLSPSKWFNSPEINNINIIPDRWVKIDV